MNKKGYGTFCVAGKKPGKKPAKQSWFSLVDEVRVPEQEGEYLLSFRWGELNRVLCARLPTDTAPCGTNVSQTASRHRRFGIRCADRAHPF
jgi:hypothetical protein